MKKYIILFTVFVLALFILTIFEFLGGEYKSAFYHVITSIHRGIIDYMSNFSLAVLLLVMFLYHEKLEKIIKLIGKEIVCKYKPGLSDGIPDEDINEEDGVDEINSKSSEENISTATSFYRIWLGQGNRYFKDCFENGYIGMNFLASKDLNTCSKDPNIFEQEIVGLIKKEYGEDYPIRGISYAVTCLKRIFEYIKKDDIILARNPEGDLYAAKVFGEYQYRANGPLNQSRAVKWSTKPIDLSKASEPLKNTLKHRYVLTKIDSFGNEIEQLLKAQKIFN